MILKSSEELAPTAAEVVREVSLLLGRLLPDVDLHHIGATAIRGALTKGDLDVLLRVESSRFKSAVAVLRKHFDVKQPQNWDPYFASFGSDSGYALPLGVQLVVRDSEADFFLFVHKYVASHPEILATYNRVKREFADRSADEYWAAKDRVLAPIAALKAKPANKALQPTPMSVTPPAAQESRRP